VTLKTLVTGVAAAVVVGGAAAGVTSIASGTITAAPAVQPVVWDIPMPAAPAPDLTGPITQTVNNLGSGGSFAGKAAYIQGLGRFTGKGVELKYNDAVAKGYLPLTATVLGDPDLNGNTATATIEAQLANGEVRSMPLTFVPGGPTGWQLSSQSLFALGELVG
jgi:hypothetical protein